MPGPSAGGNHGRQPSDSVYLLIGVGVALLILAFFGLVAGQSASGSAILAESSTADGDITCLHSLDFPRVTGELSVPVERSGRQVFHIDASDGLFRPNALSAKADAPIDIVTSQGERCTERISFDRLGIAVRLEERGATLRLPRLTTGVYPFRCELGEVAGILVVR